MESTWNGGANQPPFNVPEDTTDSTRFPTETSKSPYQAVTDYLEYSDEWLLMMPVRGRFREWMLMRSWTFRGYGLTFAVPAGFVTDLSSVPRPLWALISPFDLSRVAPLVHDYLYSLGGVEVPHQMQRDGDDDRLRIGRREADLIFYDLMREEGVPRWRSFLAWLGVRIGGFFGWMAYRRRAMALGRGRD